MVRTVCPRLESSQAVKGVLGGALPERALFDDDCVINLL